MVTELEEASGNELRDFKELSLGELRRGYVIHRGGTYTYVFCGTSFETGVIYHSHGRDVTVERAIREYMQEIHSGIFWPTPELDKTPNGLIEVQKTLLSYTYKGKSTDEIGEVIGISTATICAHELNLQKAKKGAKVLLALLEILEGEEPPVPRPVHGESGAESSGIKQTDDLFSLDMLYPSFTQFRYKRGGRCGTAEPRAEEDLEHNHVYR